MRNLSDGESVDVQAEGGRAQLEQLLALLKQGPPAAYVEDIDFEWQMPTGQLNGFAIR